MDQVSIALCTYNGELYLKKQLESLQNQTSLPQEIVIVDDGSKDSTVDILEEFKKKSNLNIQIFQNEKNLGYIKNFEKAINLCQNDIVLLCDQDDIWRGDKVKRVLDAFQKNSKLDLLCHNVDLVDENGSQKKLTLWQVTAFDRFLEKYLNKENTVLNRVVIFGNTVSGASMAFKKSKLKINFDANYPIAMAHDYQILLFFLTFGTVRFIDECLMDYRLHEDQNIGIPLNFIQQTRRETDFFYQKRLLHKCLYRIWVAHKKMKLELPKGKVRDSILLSMQKWEGEARKQYFAKGNQVMSMLYWQETKLKYSLYQKYLYVKKLLRS